MAILITGATGFVGQHLLKLVEKPVVTSRSRSKAMEKLGDQVADVIEWDPMSGPVPIDPDMQIDGVISLMGEPIAEGRWSDEKKRRIRDSRVVGTRNLIAGLRNLNRLPSTFVSASAVGIYGSQADTIIDESNSKGEGFLVDVCREWEAAANEFSDDGVRVVLVRIGIVLGEGGGALEKMLPIFKLGLGGKLGAGDQYVPWIHVEDLASMLRWAVDQEEVQGPVNASAPEPVTNLQFTKAIGKALRRPTIFPVPKFALKLALGEFAESLLYSQRVVPKVALDNGYEFQFERIEQAIADVVGS